MLTVAHQRAEHSRSHTAYFKHFLIPCEQVNINSRTAHSDTKSVVLRRMKDCKVELTILRLFRVDFCLLWLLKRHPLDRIDIIATSHSDSFWTWCRYLPSFGVQLTNSCFADLFHLTSLPYLLVKNYCFQMCYQNIVVYVALTLDMMIFTSLYSHVSPLTWDWTSYRNSLQI